MEYTVANVKALALTVVESVDDQTIRDLAAKVTIMPELPEITRFALRSAINALVLDYLNEESQFHVDAEYYGYL